MADGVPEENIIRFAFDSVKDLRLLGENYPRIKQNKEKVDPVLFIEYIERKTSDDRHYYLLLDEVQNLDDFEAVLNGYLRMDNYDVYVTGSSSRFLSKDIITDFAGGGDVIHVLPLSYSEFHDALSGSEDELMEQYMLYGGLPAVALMDDVEEKVDYLQTQMKHTYLRDVIDRYGLHKEESLTEIVDVLASGISTLVNPSRLSDTFKTVKKEKLSPPTIKNYISYLEDAFLIKCVKRYDIKGRKYIGTPYKVYFEDVGLRNAHLDYRQFEESHIMENIVFNELRYRGFIVDVGIVNASVYEDGVLTRKQYEVDFVANKGSRRYYIQSAFNIPTGEKKEQEIRSFRKIPDSFKKIIIVNGISIPRRDEEGFVMIGFRQFLLDENSLDL